MFMRLRSHTCHYCHTIDEAHDRRHKKIAGQIRHIYESCGLVDWTIIPVETEEGGRLIDYQAERDETDCDLTLEDTSSSKRERKDAKSLAKAASRSRVIGRDEILHVDTVIHSAEGVLSGDNDGPCNTDEMEEIERHLKYNAHVYNTQSDRRALKKFARLPDVDVDFDAEMERIFDVFRITDLVQRNTRNRGLLGKELKTFQRLVDGLKKGVVEDLILVKRDTLETRMRRAGYLRYANKAAHNIVEDRYADRDWKTGEKHLPKTSSSSGIASPDEASSSSQKYVPLFDLLSLRLRTSSTYNKGLSALVPFTWQGVTDRSYSTSPEDSPPLPPTTTQHGPDQRHLEKIHMRVTGEDGLGQKVIEPYHAPLIAMPAASTPRQRAVQLKVVTNGAASSGTTLAGSTSKKTRQTKTAIWETVLSGKKPKLPSVKPAWGMTAAGRPVAPIPSPVNPWGPEACEIPDFRSFAGVVVQPPDASAVTSSKGPDRFIEADHTSVTDTAVAHAIVSHKKTKKYEREARRKAKKAGLQEQTPTVLETTRQDEDLDTALAADEGIPHDLSNDIESSRAPPLDAIMIETQVETVSGPAAELLELEPCAVLPGQSSPMPLRVTNNSKHMHWVKFKRQFIVDQLTGPFLPSSSGCSHSTTCVYESNGVQDCPYHAPRMYLENLTLGFVTNCCPDCPCVDPLHDECYLTYPSDSILTSGPYNRLHGEKLLAMYQQHDHFKGRIMLVDNDVINYFMLDPNDRAKDRGGLLVPKRLATEYSDFADGCNPGPLMEQERLFERLWHKNKMIKRQISKDMLSEFQKKHQHGGAPVMCYCHDQVSEDSLPKQVVECAHRDCQINYFHKACIKKLGVGKVSRWYCTWCEPKMQSLAYQTLHDMGYDDVPDEEADLQSSMEVLQDKFNLPDSAMDDVRSRMEEYGPRARIAAATAIAMDNMF
jgi:hypothetical protein